LGDNPCFLSVLFLFVESWKFLLLMTSPYHFYFIFVPRIVSNRRKVRFGEVAVPKQNSVLRCKNSWKFPERCINLNFLCTCPRLLYNFCYLCTFWFEQQKIFKKIDLYLLFYFDRFLPLFAFASWSLSFWVLLITELLREVATVDNVLIDVVIELKLIQKWIYYLA
jgi:hypothetical protein